MAIHLSLIVFMQDLKQSVTDLVVSTDDEEIAKIFWIGLPYPLRPPELAEDHVFSRDALNHAVIETENIFNKKYDYVVELPAVAIKNQRTWFSVRKLIRTMLIL